jgi:Fic family protein
MAQNKKSVKEWLSEEFGAAALKALSENATVEEYNAFESGGSAIFEQLNGLETTNGALTTERDTLNLTVLDLTSKLEGEQANTLKLTNELTQMTVERDRYKAVYTEKAEGGTNLPKSDVEMMEAFNALPEDHPDRLAYAAFASKTK